MDFAEVRELNHIIVPPQSLHIAKMFQVATEEELINVCKNTGLVFNLSPKPSIYKVA